MGYKLLSKKCLNSNWAAIWLSEEGQEYCQCGFDCKVKVRNIDRNYDYIVGEKEYKALKIINNEQ